VLRWGGGGQLMRASRWQLRSGTCLGEPHRHDFFEVFWIEAGRGVHELNGGRQPLAAGDCVFLRPADRHTLHADPESELRWTNVSFPAAAERSLRRRYAAALGWWPWRAGGEPVRRRLREEVLPRAKEFAAVLPVDGGRVIDLDWFVTGLLRMLDPPGQLETQGPTPAWLEQAVAAFSADAEALRHGLPALLARAERSPEHLARTVRRHYAMTPTDLVRELRLQQAARTLRLGGTAIVDVALDAGFDNLSYFYRCFRAKYGCTPRQFRQMLMVGDEPPLRGSPS